MQILPPGEQEAHLVVMRWTCTRLGSTRIREAQS